MHCRYVKFIPLSYVAATLVDVQMIQDLVDRVIREGMSVISSQCGDVRSVNVSVSSVSVGAHSGLIVVIVALK